MKLCSVLLSCISSRVQNYLSTCLAINRHTVLEFSQQSLLDLLLSHDCLQLRVSSTLQNPRLTPRKTTSKYAVKYNSFVLTLVSLLSGTSVRFSFITRSLSLLLGHQNCALHQHKKVSKKSTVVLFRCGTPSTIRYLFPTQSRQ